jgi:hypothetical protein
MFEYYLDKFRLQMVKNHAQNTWGIVVRHELLMLADHGRQASGAS